MPHLFVLMVVAPFVVAALIPLFSIRFKNLSFLMTALTSLFSFCSVLYLVVIERKNFPLEYHLGGWVPPLGIGLYLDKLGSFFLLLVTFIFLAVVLFSRFFLGEDVEASKRPLYYTLLLLLLAGMLGFILAADLFNMFVFFEVFSISSYALIAASGKLPALRASFKYLLMGTVSMLFMLMGIAMLYSLTGVLHIPLVAKELANIVSSQTTQVILALTLIAFGIEAALFPLHTWLPQAHSLAPSPVSALLSALIIKMGVLGLIKVIYYIFGGCLNELSPVLMIMAVLAIFFGAFFALGENDIKLILAHSSISQIGYMVLGLSLATYFSLVGGLFQLLSHALAKATLFLCVGIVISQTGLRSLKDLSGAGKESPILMIFFGLALASLASLPLTGGFAAKYYLCKGAIEKGAWVIALAILVGSLLSLFYSFKIFSSLFISKPVKKVSFKLSWWAIIPLGCLSVVSFLIGIFPRLGFVLIEPAVGALLRVVR